jgi:hypothetical protein
MRLPTCSADSATGSLPRIDRDALASLIDRAAKSSWALLRPSREDIRSLSVAGPLREQLRREGGWVEDHNRNLSVRP